MKRLLIALGLLTTSCLPLLSSARPAYALQTITINEVEGRAKSVGRVQTNAHYILKGAFGGRSNDSDDRFVFDVRTEGTYTLVFNPANISQKIRNPRLSLLTFSTFGPSRSVGSISTNQALSVFLPRGRYQILLSGQSTLGAGTPLRHQTHLITPR